MAVTHAYRKDTNNTKKDKQTVESQSSTMRLGSEVFNALKEETIKLNKSKKGSKKIMPPDILEVLLPLLNDDHRQQILAQTITSKDRQKVAFLNFKKKFKNATKDDFLDLIQYGEIKINDYLPTEMKKQNGILEKREVA